jgi:UDP-N-acetylmuramoyl-tripeptide--D-alanyl-D-alanine ligase
MSALWTSAELRAATGGRLEAEVAVARIGFDSRQVEAGDLFVALKAARDGHDFVPAAFAAGAAAVLVEHGADSRCLMVADTLAALQALGRAARGRSMARVVAVTGSVGKTTTKDMLRLALGAFGPTHAAAASFNNHIGVPTTLANMPRDAAFAAIELGMNNRGEIAPLARMARPHVAIITTIGTAHLGRMGSLDEIAAEKGDILEGLEPGGTAILPADSAYFPALQARAGRVLSFGLAEGADIRLLAYEAGAEGGRASIATPAGALELVLAAPGRHLAENATAVLAAIHALGLDVAQAARALENFGAGAGRGQRRAIAAPGGAALLLDESYNASGPSVLAALAVLKAQPGRRVAILGDMLELGEHGPAMHLALGPAVAESLDLLHTVGPLMGAMLASLPVGLRGHAAVDSSALAPLMRAALRAGDAVLVKGSLGMRMATIIHALDTPS